jgi:hypothetical protein
VPPVEAAPKVAKAPAKAPAAKAPAAKAPAASKPAASAPTAAPAPAAAQPNPYAQAPAAAQANPYAQAAPAQQPQPYNYGPYVPQPPQGLSITSMVLGIVGVLFAFGGFGLLLNIAAVITGHMASKRQPYAKPFWLTGIITGYAGIGISLLVGAIILASILIPIFLMGSYGAYNY